MSVVLCFRPVRSGLSDSAPTVLQRGLLLPRRVVLVRAARLSSRLLHLFLLLRGEGKTPPPPHLHNFTPPSTHPHFPGVNSTSAPPCEFVKQSICSVEDPGRDTGCRCPYGLFVQLTLSTTCVCWGLECGLTCSYFSPPLGATHLACAAS